MPYPPGAVERAMKVHEIIMRALDGQLSWIQTAEILGRSPRSIRRLRWKLQHEGYDGLFDRRRRGRSHAAEALEVGGAPRVDSRAGSHGERGRRGQRSLMKRAR